MRIAIIAKNLPELRRLIACSAERANTTGPTVLKFPMLSWLPRLTDTAFSVKAAEVLIENGADIERRGKVSSKTPLELAASDNYLSLVKFLVAKGAKRKTQAMVSATSGGHFFSAKAQIYTHKPVYLLKIF